MLARIAGGLGAVAAALLGWGWFEAGWVRLRTVDVEIPGLCPELEGLRLIHLSDFHLGVPSGSARAVERAVAWVEERRPDLVLVTGDLLTHPRGEPKLRELLRRLGPRTYAVLGNHDFGDARDPLAAASRRDDLAPAHLLLDDSVELELRGRRVQLVGIDPTSYRSGQADPEGRADPDADLRILLCHYPYVFDRVRAGVYQLVLAGHLHDGQIAIPYGRGKLRLAHFDWRYTKGLYRRGGSALHVSPGLGTTFVPFRLFARPEATELVLRPA
ncbi:MAG: metallophosphoesterase family protein [Actinobacteria bacterium]|nr:metallophosphoesterase family protein [Actinomycetota bacterium]